MGVSLGTCSAITIFLFFEVFLFFLPFRRRVDDDDDDDDDKTDEEEVSDLEECSLLLSPFELRS